MTMSKMATILVSAMLAFASSAMSADNPFLGTWKVKSASSAPWSVKETAVVQTTDPYLQSTVAIAENRLQGPASFQCDNPAYTVESLPPDIIFGGGLAIDPDRPTDEPSDPLAMKRAFDLGLDTINILTLENRCSELAFHMVNPDTILFAADNRIYTLQRQPQ